MRYVMSGIVLSMSYFMCIRADHRARFTMIESEGINSADAQPDQRSCSCTYVRPYSRCSTEAFKEKKGGKQST